MTWEIFGPGAFGIGGGGGGGAETFDELTDTPASKTGADGKYPRVSGGSIVYDDVVVETTVLDFATYADMTDPTTHGVLKSADYIQSALGSVWQASGVGYPMLISQPTELYSMHMKYIKDETNNRLTRLATVVVDEDTGFPFPEAGLVYSQQILDTTATFPTEWDNLPVFQDSDDRIYSQSDSIVINPDGTKVVIAESTLLGRPTNTTGAAVVASHIQSPFGTRPHMLGLVSDTTSVTDVNIYLTDGTPIGHINANVASLALQYQGGHLWINRTNNNNAWVSLDPQDVLVINPTANSGHWKTYNISAVPCVMTVRDIDIIGQGYREFFFKDTSGLASPTNPITIQTQTPATYKIDGVLDSIQITTPYGIARLYTNGGGPNGLWTF